jgi:prepilin-type N-terminal cleavage/methylation domain-containing protein
VSITSSHKKDLPLGKRTSGILSSSDGFTLVELLIVMAIVLVMSTLAIGAYNNFVQRARETSVIVFLRYVHKAEMEHQFFHDSYSGKFKDLEELGSIPENIGKTITKVGKRKRIMEDYAITLRKRPGNTWFARAKPVNRSKEVRWFYIDETGVSRFKIGKRANKNSPKL